MLRLQGGDEALALFLDGSLFLFLFFCIRVYAGCILLHASFAADLRYFLLFSNMLIRLIVL